MLSYKKSLIKLTLDTGAIFLASILATLIRFEERWVEFFTLKYFFVYLMFYLAGYFYKKTELKSWRYTNSLDVLSLIAVNTVSFLGMTAYFIVG